jgi:hypothetical protein
MTIMIQLAALVQILLMSKKHLSPLTSNLTSNTAIFKLALPIGKI